MYYEYWGMNRHPFDNVPDPSMYFRAHASVETAVAEVLFAVEEGDEVLAVIVGEVGLGKTTSLRVILDSLDQDKYRIAFITNPDVTFTMMLRDIIGQLKGETCEFHRKDDLLEEFNRVLFQTADDGKRVLIFIDEGNAFKPMNLESLRLLTNMQEDDRNLFTIILAGQPKLARMLEAPSRANLFQRIGVYCHLQKMESWETVRDYIDHRLERAGTTKPIFTDDAIKMLYEKSEKGVPRLVNKIAKLALKAGETNGITQIGPDLVAAIGGRFERFTRTVRAKAEETKDAPVDVKSNGDGAAEAAPKAKKQRKGAKKTDAKPLATDSGRGSTEETSGPVFVSSAETADAPAMELAASLDAPAPAELQRPVIMSAHDELDAPEEEVHIEHGFSASAAYQRQELGYTDESKADEKSGVEDGQDGESACPSMEQVCLDEALRPEVLAKARGADKMERMKMAGQLAAEEIKKHPEFVSHAPDPVVMWKELRNEILTALTARAS